MFTRSKPEQLIVDGDTVFNVTSWVSLYVKFLKYVVDNYGDDFKTILQSNYWSDHPGASYIRKEEKITDDFYVETNFATIIIIKNILLIAGYYSFEQPVMVRLK